MSSSATSPTFPGLSPTSTLVASPLLPSNGVEWTDIYQDALVDLRKKVPGEFTLKEYSSFRTATKSRVPLTEQHALDTLQDIRNDGKYSTKFHRFFEFISKMFEPLRLFKSGLDTLCQVEPTACLVWGSMKILIEIAREVAHVPTLITTGIESLVRYFPVHSKYTKCLKIRTDEGDMPLRAPMVAIYVEYLTFGILAQRVAKSPKWATIRHATQADSPLKTCLKAIETQSRLVHDIAAAMTLLNLDTLGKDISLILDILRAKHSSDSSSSNHPGAHNMVPGLLSQDFVGREPQLKFLEQTLDPENEKNNGARVGIHGLTGIGKTQLMLKYEATFRTCYTSQLFLVASSRVKLLDSIRETLETLGFRQHADNASAQIQELRDWLSQHERWLLLIDNLSSETVNPVLEIIPSAAQGHVIVTSQSQKVVRDICNSKFCLSMPELDLDDAIEMFVSEAEIEPGNMEQQEKVDIVKAMALMPHAIEQAASYIRVNHLKPSDFLARYNNTPERVLEWGDALDGAADDGIKEKAQRSSLGKHLGLVFDSLEAVHPDALIVLKFYSLLEPETIPLFEAWLRPDRSAGFPADIGAAPKQSSRRFIGCLSALNCFKKLPDNPPADKDEPTWHPADDLIHIFQDEVRRERAIAKLCDLSLVHRVRNANRVLWMHDLTRKSVRASIPQDAIRKWTTAGIEVVYHMMPEEDGTVEEHVWVDKCLLAAMALIREAPARGLEVREYACLLALCALSNLHHNAWPLSRKQFEQSKPLYEKYLGQDHKRTILLLHKLALATRHDGDMSRAEAYCRQALKLYEQKLGPTDSKTLNVLNDLASTIERAGRLKEAESMFRKLYEQEEKASGMQGPRTMAAAHNLALCLHNQGRLREAESIYRDAIKASEIHLGRDDPGTLKTLSNYAVTLDHDGKFDEAQKTYNLVRNSFIQVMGLDHHLTLRLRGNMAGVLRQQGKFDQAESVMRDCLDTVEQTFGPESFETITDLYEMGEIWQAKGEVERARNAFEKTMSYLSGDMLDHPVVFRFIDSWGAAEREMGHLDVAREKSLDAYNRFERLLGWDDPYTLMAANDHAEVLHAEGKHDEAQDLLARCLDSFAQLLGKEHPHYAMVLNNLGRVAWARKTEDPMPYFVKAHKVLTNRLGEGHYCTATVSVNIARSLFYAGNTTDALAALETSHDVLVAAVGKIHPLSSACDTTAGLILASRGDQPSLTEAERRFSSYRKVSEEMGNKKNADYFLNVCLLLLVRKLLQYSDSDLKQLHNILNSPDAGRVAPWDIPGLGKRSVAQLASMDPNKFSFQGYLPLAVGETIRLRWGRKTCWREAEIAKLQD